MRRGRSGLAPRPRDRGQSVSVNYTLSLVIVSVLISVLFLSMGGLLEAERTRATKGELDVIGNRIAADIAAADRLAQTTRGDARVEIRTTIPPFVAGSGYTVSMSSSVMASGYHNVTISLSVDEVGVTRTVSVRTATFVEDQTLNGGSYTVIFDGSSIEVDDAN